MSNVVERTKKPALSIEAQLLIVHQMLVFQKKKKEKKPFGNKSKNINEICFQCFQGPFFSVIHNL